MKIKMLDTVEKQVPVIEVVDGQRVTRHRTILVKQGQIVDLPQDIAEHFISLKFAEEVKDA